MAESGRVVTPADLLDAKHDDPDPTGPLVSVEPHEPGRVCSSCGAPLIQRDMTVQGPRGAWVHEVSRTITCPYPVTTPARESS